MSHKQRAIECIGHIEGAGKASITDRAADIRAVRDEAEAALRRVVSAGLDAVTAKHQAEIDRDTKAAIDAEAKAVAAELDEAIREDYAAPNPHVAEALKEYMGMVSAVDVKTHEAPEFTKAMAKAPKFKAKPAPKKKAKP